MTSLTCPKCGYNVVRIVYKDDECSEVDFYDCTWCGHVWIPAKTITQNPNEQKMNINMVKCLHTWEET